MVSPLPAEICASIFAEVEGLDPSTLFALCRTCRLFLHQAQRILFRNVDLEGCSMRATKSWCLAVTRHPHLAQRVHALSLQLPETMKLQPADGTKIQRALTLCVNLKELKITFEKSSKDSGANSVNGWLITECPFRLTKFHNLYFEHRFTSRFLTAQSEIQVLSVPRGGPLHLSDEQLPNLVAVRVGDVQNLPAGRPLQRVEASFSYYQDYTPLLQYSGTLTTLNLVREWVDDQITILSTMTAIANLLPALVHFGIAEVEKRRSPPRPSPVNKRPDKILQKFHRLETFVLLLRNGARYRVPDSAQVHHIDEQSLKHLASAIMKACPTLRRTVVGHEDEPGEEITCTLRRGLDKDDIQCEMGTEFDFDAMSMFWNP